MYPTSNFSVGLQFSKYVGEGCQSSSDNQMVMHRLPSELLKLTSEKEPLFSLPTRRDPSGKISHPHLPVVLCSSPGLCSGEHESSEKAKMRKCSCSRLSSSTWFGYLTKGPLVTTLMMGAHSRRGGQSVGVTFQWEDGWYKQDKTLRKLS